MVSRDTGTPQVRADGPEAGGRERAGRLERLLRVPLFWKLLFAHLVVVTLAVLVALWLSTRFAADQPTWMVATVSASSGLLLSTLMTAAVLRLALAPLDQLEAAARRALEEESTPTRLELHPVADEELRAVVTLINELLSRAGRHRQQLRELAARALGSAEAERRRVGLLLQDRVAQQIAAALVQLRLLAPHGAGGDAGEGADARERVRASIVEALEEVRRSARALRPPELEELGLERAVTALVRETREATACEIESDVEEIGAGLSGPAALALFRIVQDALLGLVQGSGAGRVRVTVRREGDTVVGEVMSLGGCPPIGDGLDPEAGGAALGLLAVRERARFVGGSVTIEELSEDASRLQVTVPIERGLP